MNSCNKEQVGSIEYSSTSGNMKDNDSDAAKDIMSSFITGGITSQVMSGKSASILFTYTNPVFPEKFVEADPIGHINAIVNPKKNIFHHSNLVKIIRILGLMALISYMVVILFTWMFANIEGYVYFSAGEPVLAIKYLEWILGYIGIFVAINYLQKELNGTEI